MSDVPSTKFMMGLDFSLLSPCQIWLRHHKKKCTYCLLFVCSLDHFRLEKHKQSNNKPLDSHPARPVWTHVAGELGSSCSPQSEPQCSQTACMPPAHHKHSNLNMTQVLKQWNRRDRHETAWNTPKPLWSTPKTAESASFHSQNSEISDKCPLSLKIEILCYAFFFTSCNIPQSKSGFF